MLRAKALFGQHCVGPEPQLGRNQRDAIACALPVLLFTHVSAEPMLRCWFQAGLHIGSAWPKAQVQAGL